MADELNIITTDANAVNVTTEDRIITITNDSDATTVTLSAAETTTVQIATIGPKGDKGDIGNVDTSTLATTGSNVFIGNQRVTGNVIVTGSLTVSGSSTFTNIGPSIFSGSINITNGITGSLLGTASFATTASYALNAGAGAGFPFSGSAVITGSLLVTEGITGSFSGSVVGYVPNEATISFVTTSQTSSFVLTNQTSSFVQNNQTSSFVLNSQTSSFVTNEQTSSFVLNSQTSSFVQNSQTSSFVTNDQTSSFITSNQTGSFVKNEQTSSFVTNNQTSSFVQNNQTSSFLLVDQTSSMLQPYVLSSQLNSYLTTGSTNITQTISGSLIIDQNLTVLGSQSIQYITSSQLNIQTNLITVNTATPAVRFGGLAVYDSGSTGTGLTGSILWDSQNNVWIYTNPSGSEYDGAMFLTGPKNNGTTGNEVGINSWYAAIGNGSHHMTSSVIWNSGSLIRLETNTQITGGLVVSNGITGSFSGSVFGYVPNEATTSFITNQQTSSFVTTSQTASFVKNNQTASFATTGSNTFIGNQTISGSLIISGSVGIGTTTPQHLLDVSGSARIVNKLIISNNAEITGSGAYVGLSGSANINVVYPPQPVDMGGSILFTRDAGDYLSLSPAVDFTGNISTYGYILNCWFKLTENSFNGAFQNGAPIIYSSTDTSTNLYVVIDGTLNKLRVNAGSELTFALPETIITNKWYYISLGYNINSNQNFVYLNGTASVDTYNDSGTGASFDLVGADGSGNYFPGYITNLRLLSKPNSNEFISASLVPTASLGFGAEPSGTEVLLLISSSGTWIDDTAGLRTVTTHGSSIAFSDDSPYDYYTSPVDYIWNFNNDATLVLPQSGTILNNDLSPYTPISAQTASYVNPLNQNVIITGSLTVSGSSTFTNIGPAVFSGSVVSTAGFTGSFSGSVVGYIQSSETASFITATQTGSFLLSSQTGSFITTTQTGSMTVLSSSFATTASYIDPIFISASAAAAGFGSGGPGGGLTYQQVQRLIALGM